MPIQKKKRTHIGDQEGLKLSAVTDDVTPEEAKFRYDEIQKCIADIDYFTEHYYHIINQEGDKVVIKMFPKQKEFLHMIRDHNRVIISSARQQGKSETYSIFCTHKICFERNYNIVIAAQRGDTAREILTKIKNAYELIPNWMKPGIKVWNESKVIFENGVMIKACPTGESVLRGLSVSCLCLDEFSFVLPSVQEKFFTSALPTVSSKGKNAKVIIVSTPNGVGDVFYKIWKDATESKDSIWHAMRMDWWDRPDRDEAWHQRELRSLGSEEKFQQEYGNSFLNTAGNKLITDDKILSLIKTYENLNITPMLRKVDPSDPSSHTYTEYFPYRKGRTYIGAVDTAEGTGQDSSVFYILDITEGTKIYLCAKFDSSKVIPSDYAKVIYFIGRKYGMPPLMVESNACGLALIDGLTKTGFTNPETHQREFYTNIIDYNRKKNKQPGIFSHVVTKSKACMNVQEIVQSNSYELVLPDKDLLDELGHFEKVSSSKHITYKAPKGKHDDHVMALIWGLFVYNDEILLNHFTVEYKRDAQGQQTSIPSLIVPQTEDIDEVKRLANIESADKRERDLYNLSVKWREMGDEQRSDYILSRLFVNEWGDSLKEGTSEDWASNPYQLDPSMFSDGLFGERYHGQGRGRGGYSTGWDDTGFGCIV